MTATGGAGGNWSQKEWTISDAGVGAGGNLINDKAGGQNGANTNIHPDVNPKFFGHQGHNYGYSGAKDNGGDGACVIRYHYL